MRRRCVPHREMEWLLASMDARDALLDDVTAERLLRGQLPVDDAPPRYRTVTQALALLAAPPTEAELAGEAEAVAAIAAHRERATHCDPLAARTSSWTKRRLAQLAAVSMLGTVGLFGGLAAANALPGVAQGVASDVFSKVGVNVPDPSSHAGTQADERGSSDTEAPDASPSSGHAGWISDPADEAAPVSGAPAGGQSQSPSPGPAAARPADPLVDTPIPSGTGTGDAAGGGPTHGADAAETHSEGRSSAGSGNAANGLAHRP